MKRVIGFCNLHDNPHLGLLTSKRPIGAITFLGRYGLMDFTLSNFSNSGIDNVHVLVESRAAAIRSHIGSGQIWVNNTKTGSLDVHINEKAFGSPKFNTDIANIYETVDYLKNNYDYVVISPVCFVCSLNLKPAFDAHVNEKHDITVVYAKRHDCRENFAHCDLLKLDASGHITESYFSNEEDDANVSLETFIISREVFLNIIAESRQISRLYSIRDMVKHYITHRKYNIYGYCFDGYVAPILSMEHYIKFSFELLDYSKRCQLFKPEWPIYTKTHNTPPALYGANAEVSNSFIANGAMIHGTVENSIISRDVVINEGAVVKNSILFTASEVGKNVQVEYVLSDKNVKFTTSKEAKGAKDEFLYVRGGSII